VVTFIVYTHSRLPEKGFGKVTSSVLFDRVTGLFALLSIALFGYVSLPDSDYDLALILFIFSVSPFSSC
jgi:hypothetical protein